MDGSTVMLVAMVAMMALMCGGMLAGAGRTLLRRRKRRGGAD
jgi:hypothetical protein